MLKIAGIVIKGKQHGRKLGFPTANLKVKIKPDSGIYAGEVILDNQKYKAAIFVPKKGNFIEAHILDFNLDIYEKTIEILIRERIREVKKFKNDTELKRQIKKDLKIIKK
jgi:riboflavin kinase / FMN adenylyltransferase